MNGKPVPTFLFSTVMSKFGPILLLGVILTGVTGCRRNQNAGPLAGPPGAAMRPVEVGVVTILAETTTVTTELPGRVNAVRVAEVRARATGILLKRLFEEGADVSSGDVLFEIDPAPLQAGYDSAKANLAKTEAARNQAQAKATRYRALVGIKAISQQEYDDANAAALQSEAEVLVANAAAETAALDLGYAKVTAPISGHIGKALVTEGAFVSASEATQLAVIQQVDPIYVNFTQASADVLKLRRALEAGKLHSVAPDAAKVSLQLEDGSIYAHTGKLLFSDISVDETTGSVTLRAEFPNPDKWLLPGMFVRGQIEQAVDQQAITVPQRAVTRNATGSATTLVVNDRNQVESRMIQVDAVSGNRWIVTDGLKAGERVIVEGLQRAVAGSTVIPVPFQTNSTNAQPASGAASQR